MVFAQACLLLSSPDPERLIGFYSSLVDGLIVEGYTKNDFLLKISSSFNINIFKPSNKVSSSHITPPSVAICLQESPSPNPLLTLQGLTDEALKAGAKLIEQPKLENCVAEAWFQDLDGNKFLIFVPLANI